MLRNADKSGNNIQECKHFMNYAKIRKNFGQN